MFVICTNSERYKQNSQTQTNVIQEGTVRRIESMQQSSATPKNQDVGRGLRKIVACSQSSLQCLLVSIVFGTVSSLHPTSIFTLVLLFYGQDTVDSLASLVHVQECCLVAIARARSAGHVRAGGGVLLSMRNTHKMATETSRSAGRFAI